MKGNNQLKLFPELRWFISILRPVHCALLVNVHQWNKMHSLVIDPYSGHFRPKSMQVNVYLLHCNSQYPFAVSPSPAFIQSTIPKLLADWITTSLICHYSLLWPIKWLRPSFLSTHITTWKASVDWANSQQYWHDVLLWIRLRYSVTIVVLSNLTTSKKHHLSLQEEHIAP
jgi:hypothetical protein